MTLLGAILAGGAGTRIGGGKHRQQLGDKMLLDWALAWLKPQVKALAIVGNTPDLSDWRHQVLPDDHRLSGPASGLKSALQWASQDAEADLLVIPCDMPYLPDTLAEALHTPDVAVPSVEGSAIWAISRWPSDRVVPALTALARYPDDAAPSLRQVFEDVAAITVPFAADAAFLGINTRDELDEARQHL